MLFPNSPSSSWSGSPSTTASNRLEPLPPELIAGVLRSLDSIDDLAAAITALRRLLDVFKPADADVLFDILQAELGPVLKEAVLFRFLDEVVWRGKQNSTARPVGGGTPDFHELMNGNIPIIRVPIGADGAFVLDRSDAMTLVRTYVSVRFFIDRYCESFVSEMRKAYFPPRDPFKHFLLQVRDLSPSFSESVWIERSQEFHTMLENTGRDDRLALNASTVALSKAERQRLAHGVYRWASVKILSEMQLNGQSDGIRALAAAVEEDSVNDELFRGAKQFMEPLPRTLASLRRNRLYPPAFRVTLFDGPLLLRMWRADFITNLRLRIQEFLKEVPSATEACEAVLYHREKPLRMFFASVGLPQDLQHTIGPLDETVDSASSAAVDKPGYAFLDAFGDGEQQPMQQFILEARTSLESAAWLRQQRIEEWRFWGFAFWDPDRVEAMKTMARFVEFHRGWVYSCSAYGST